MEEILVKVLVKNCVGNDGRVGGRFWVVVEWICLAHLLHFFMFLCRICGCIRWVMRGGKEAVLVLFVDGDACMIMVREWMKKCQGEWWWCSCLDR